MKKILTAWFICTAVMPAMATDYDMIYEDTYDYTADYTASCPVCDCGDDTRDSYFGVRVYKNEHSAFSYNHPNGHKEKFKRDNFAFGTTAGNNLADWVRVEYETLYMGGQKNMHDTKFDYDLWANFVNAYLLRDFDGVVAPYIGAGLGLTGIWGDIGGQMDNDFDLSYQALTGVLFKLNKRIDLDVGFKYVNYGKVTHRDAVTKIDATQIYIGAIYKFGM